MISLPSRSSPRCRGSALTAITPSTAIRSPFARRSPAALPFSTTMPATSALVRIVPPMREEHLRERLADAMHAALDDAAADILDRRDEHPREVASQRIVRGEPGVQSGRREEEPHLGAFEGLLDPRAGRLHDEPIAVRSVGRTELLDETRGPAVHGAHDGGFGRREPSVERPPGVGVAPREPGDARRRGVELPPDDEGAAVRGEPPPGRARRGAVWSALP